MLFKLFLITLVISITTAAKGGEGPKKIRWEVQDDEDLVKPLADPIDGIEYRLPNNTLPLHYDIYLSTDIHIPFFSFDGIVTIRIKALNDTPDITVHFRQLVIMNIELSEGNGTLIQSSVNYSQDEVREFLIIRPQNSLIKDQTYHVKIGYLGTLRNDDAGFYLGSYVDNNGVRKYHATTQFESTDARHAFPW
jgi:aminopeptidase N